ncbi:MAG: transposase [Pirellulaceae bacterium]|nr:transposase [Pirellulaceae bacterium]
MAAKAVPFSKLGESVLQATTHSEASGAELCSLPPCSPDLNPIELAFSKLKMLLRDGAARRAGVAAS